MVQIAFALSLVCLGAVGTVSWFAMERQRADAAWVDHTHEVIVGIAELSSAASLAVSAATNANFCGS